LPYKGLDALRRRTKDELILEWSRTLSEKSRTKLYEVILFSEWVAGKGYFTTVREMIEDHDRCLLSTNKKTKYKHVEMVKKYIRTKGTKPTDRKIALSSIRAFYSDQHSDLQVFRPSDLQRMFAPDEDEKGAYGDEESKAFSLEELQQLITGLPMPYSAVVCAVWQSSMDMSAFSQFNRKLWRRMGNFENMLNMPGPLRIGWLIRAKTAAKESAEKGKPTQYFTYISDDAKLLIKRWLGERRRIIQEIKAKGQKPPTALFVVKQKNADRYVPVTGSRVGANITATAKRLGLISGPVLEPDTDEEEERTGKTRTRTKEKKTEEELKAEHRLRLRARYHIHAHELRDLFRSQHKACGMDKDAVEFFLGHEVDRLKYDKTHIYHPEWFQKEYSKMESILNIISSPLLARQGLNEQIVARFNWESLIAAGYSEAEMEEIGRRFGGLSKLPYSEREQLVEQKRRQSLNGGEAKTAANGNGKQRLVTEAELGEWIDHGARIVTQLANGKVIIELPNGTP